MGIKSVKDSVKEAVEATKAGFKEIKIKADVTARENVEKVKAVRQAIGDKVRIRMDANGQWKPKQAINIIKAMERFDLDCIEQPVDGIEGLAEVSRNVDTPVMADESLQTPNDAFRLLHENAAQVFNVYIMKSGLVNSKKILGIASAQGIPAMLGSNLELGIGTSASIHLAVSSKELSLPCDLIGTMHHSDDITTPEIEVRDGELTVPKGAGLGLTFNPGKAEKYSKTD
jgi:L-alanine-DL-glutamate epimerase-like enolase superfamily enzyme